jgi:hypothetical protein
MTAPLYRQNACVFKEQSYLDNVTLNEWSAGPSETVLLYVPGGGSLIPNDGG